MASDGSGEREEKQGEEEGKREEKATEGRRERQMDLQTNSASPTESNTSRSSTRRSISTLFKISVLKEVGYFGILLVRTYTSSVSLDGIEKWRKKNIIEMDLPCN